MKTFLKNVSGFAIIFVTLIGCDPKWKETESGTIKSVTNEEGQTLAYATTSGVKIITVDRFGFKDLNKNGTLDKYEDWRLPTDERAKDLASKMSVEQIAGLMLYSRHQPIPAPAGGPFAGTFNGKPFAESGAKSSDLSDQQIQFLTKDNLRHVLITSVESPEIAALWNNNAQALVESLGLGIPANNSSDPRHTAKAEAEYNAGAGGTISMWPGSLGMAASFDPSIVKEFGRIASIEYRALGLTTALSPQIDMATDPRWSRASGTFGEDPQLASDMARAYIDGFQTSYNRAISGGWGYESVNAMVKHWPGGGSGEAGRDAHYGSGKYAVYPGKNFEQHMIPFTQGAFDLKDGTGSASAVMPYYTISYGQDPGGENVGNSYNNYIIKDLLRGKNKYDGVVCTDWSVTGDEGPLDRFIGGRGRSWGVEKLTIAERHYKVLKAGVDQFGGNNDMVPVIEAYNMGVKELGKEAMRKRFEESAVRLLRNIFRLGLFENPYLNVEESKATVGKPEFMDKGFEAQLKSIVLLKNKGNVLPLAKNKTVYIPKKFTPAGRNFLGMPTPEKFDYPVSMIVTKKYFNVTDNPSEADFALVFISSPATGIGYSSEDAKKGGTGYVPISLQYNEYTAVDARDISIAGGDPQEKFTNRTYKGKKVKPTNITDLAMVNDTYAKMKGKPVIVSVNIANPTVFSEFEKKANALLVSFSAQDQALFEILTGAREPSALLPLQMPADMHTVEAQFEDVPRDLKCYVDNEGNTYDFAFGMNWKGVIEDERKAKYKK